MSTAAPAKPPALADRLASVRVNVRPDLEVSRHLFRGEPAYVIRDPLTFQSHRLDCADYQVFVSINAKQTLGEIFDELVAADIVDPDDPEQFYQFVFTLHRLGFLSLPLSDDKLLYKRYQARRRAERRQKALGFLFLQVPLVNPDRFLSQTMPAMRWLFSRTFFVCWLLLLAGAGYVAATRWSELIEPINGLLATQNLALMWCTLIGLKVCHEFGHAFACKHFGGHVPEMGVYLIAFTPCAYVDATASWGFPRKLHRLIVSLAGVYVELTIAAIAVFVWAATGPSLLNSAAYNVIFLASVITLLFNVNPLMRYDGYYIASDLVEVPNLRQRANKYVLSLAKRALLGVRDRTPDPGARLGAILVSFGVAATTYRVVVLTAIAALIATKFFFLGIGLAVFFLGSTLLGMLTRLSKYLWLAEETAPVRPRAIALSVVLFLVVPAGIGLIPVPTTVNAAAAIGAENETIIRASTPGFVEAVDVQRGDDVVPGQPLAQLSNLQLEAQVLSATAEHDAARLRAEAYRAQDPVAWQQEQARIAFCAADVERAAEQQAELTVRSPAPGRVVQRLGSDALGRYVAAGEPIATVISGEWRARVILTAEEYAAADPRTGDAVVLRASGASEVQWTGEIVRVKPLGSRAVHLPALTQAGGGDVMVKPGSGEATQPYFEIEIAVHVADASGTAPGIRHGMTGVLQMPGQAEPIAVHLARRVSRFLNKLRLS